MSSWTRLFSTLFALVGIWSLIETSKKTIDGWSILGGIILVVIFGIATVYSSFLDRAREVELQQKEQNAREEKERKERIDKENRLKAAKKQEAIQEKLKNRIMDFLEDNPGEHYDELELRSSLVTTHSEDKNFSVALRLLPWDEGFRRYDREIGYETTRRYYYYVDPDK